MELFTPLTRPLAAWRDRLLGRGDAACTVPILDGVLQPNQRLETATVAWAAPAGSLELRDLVSDGPGGRQLWLADGPRLLMLTPLPGGSLMADEQLVATGPITALCALPERLGGGVAFAVAGREVQVLGGRHHGRRWTGLAGRDFVGVNGLAAGGDALIATDASATHGPDDWQRDLMTLGASGRVGRLGLSDDGDHVLADGLQHPFGAVAHGSALWVSESWRHRVVALGAGDRPSPVLDQLPGYPSRLAPAAGGGFWLTVFAGRTQLVEFVLREPEFRQRMITSMPPELWIAPQLRPSRSFLEPLQGGAIKQMGVLKPWAPPRSYGLVIRLGAAGRPLASLHSRVDGQHHGVVAAAECAGALYVLSRGAGRVLRLDLSDLSSETGA
ncbi:MAG: hypothetical protein IPG93_16120 [Burkholderiales bacterium]|nr:hypothetical protein [Burkholderiales bacterium]